MCIFEQRARSYALGKSVPHNPTHHPLGFQMCVTKAAQVCTLQSGWTTPPLGMYG